MSMFKLTAIKVQESPALRGVNQDKGITSDDLTTDRVLFSDEVQDKIHEIMLEGLDYIMDGATNPDNYAGVPDKDWGKMKESMVATIKKFKLDAGGGYTDTHKAYLLENGTESGIEVVAEDFIDPKNRGDKGPADKPSAVGGSMEL